MRATRHESAAGGASDVLVFAQCGLVVECGGSSGASVSAELAVVPLGAESLLAVAVGGVCVCAACHASTSALPCARSRVRSYVLAARPR